MSQKKAHLFLSLSRKGWGEATLGIRIAREMCRAGERVIYFGHNSARPLFSGVPFEYEEVSDDTIGLLEMMLDEMVGSGEVSCIILCDFFTCTGVLSDFGTDSRFLSRYDIPLVVLDIWDCARTGFVMDFFLGKRKEIAQWLGEVPYRLIPVPIAHSENRLGAYRCLPEPVRLASKVRKHVRRNLGLTDQDRAILFCTAGWQQTQYEDEHGDRLAGAIPELLSIYLKRLEPQVHVVHVGPKALPWSAALGERYHWLPPMTADRFANVLGSIDLLLSANISATTTGQAVVSEIPVLVVQNRCNAQDLVEALACLAQTPSPELEEWIRRSLPLYAFRLWPLGFFNFLQPMLDHNPVLEAVRICELLDQQEFTQQARSLLFDKTDRQRLNFQQANYTSKLSQLPSAYEAVKSFLNHN